MTLRDDWAELTAPWRADPVAQGRRHLRACYRTFRPVDGNNDLRKFMASGLFILWAGITVGQAIGATQFNTVAYGIMSAIVYTIIGIQWGFEFKQAPLVTVSHNDNED